MKKLLMMMTVLLAAAGMMVADGIEPTGNPREVSTLEHLLWISTNNTSWGDDFIQTADIDASGTSDWNSGAGFSPIGKTSPLFTGSYDGNGHTIDHLYIDRETTDYIGLFGYVPAEVTISNLGVTNVDITGNQYVGGLVGYNSGTVSNSYSTGNVNGTNGEGGGLVGRNEGEGSTVSNSYSTASVTGSSGMFFGGLVGQNFSGTVSSSYSTGNVSCDYYVGGLVGYNYSGTVSNSYSNGSVNGVTVVAGLVGRNDGGTVSNSYSTGSVTGSGANVGGLVGYNNSTVSNSFWDTQTSGQTSSAGGTGKTTAGMTDYATFSSVWSITDGYSTSTTWSMESGVNDGYPYLSWAKAVDTSLPVTLSSFTAKVPGNSVELTWTTSAEIENAGFIIRRQKAGDRNQEEILATYMSDDALRGQGSTTEAHAYTYTDYAVEPGVTYVYTLSDVDYSGKETVHAPVTVTTENSGIMSAERFKVDRSYPNPFNASFTIPFTLNESMLVLITLHNLNGRQVKTVLESDLSAGEYTRSVNADDLSSGVYLLKVSIGSDIQTQKIVLLK